MPIEGYASFGGVHPETPGPANILANRGVLAPHTGEPYTEAMLLGLGGGIGGGYFVFEYGDVASFYFGTHAYWYEWNGAFIRRFVERIGGSVSESETGGAKAATQRTGEDFPLTEAESMELPEGLRARLEKLHAAEAEALDRLASL